MLMRPDGINNIYGFIGKRFYNIGRFEGKYFNNNGVMIRELDDFSLAISTGEKVFCTDKLDGRFLGNQIQSIKVSKEGIKISPGFGR